MRRATRTNLQRRLTGGGSACPRDTGIHTLRGVDPKINEFCASVVKEAATLIAVGPKASPLARLEYSKIDPLRESCEGALRFARAVGESDFRRTRGAQKALKGLVEFATPGVESPPFSGIFKLLLASAKAARPERGEFGDLNDKLQNISVKFNALTGHLEAVARTFRLPTDAIRVLESIETVNANEAGVSPEEFRRRILDLEGIEVGSLDIGYHARLSQYADAFGRLKTPDDVRRLRETTGFYRRERGKPSYSTVPFETLNFRREGELFVDPAILSKLGAELSFIIGDFLDVLDDPNEVLWGGKIAHGLQNFGVFLVLLREEVFDLRDSIRYSRNLSNGWTLARPNDPKEEASQGDVAVSGLDGLTPPSNIIPSEA